mmetsp:Transcript_50976/g.100201  ORF Transcript_50976/g.100201 Transcript_50976/m.100201 type:complete len:130 (+) Transcript_50976:1499-1888(+)
MFRRPKLIWAPSVSQSALFAQIELELDGACVLSSCLRSFQSFLPYARKHRGEGGSKDGKVNIDLCSTIEDFSSTLFKSDGCKHCKVPPPVKETFPCLAVRTKREKHFQPHTHAERWRERERERERERDS